ncbi:glycerophosphoryl diester phosphodiesterase [Catellatospora sp. TT07R-123]|uniref:esterase-like activity of phytase family protein n=1 Tax=Catellatospora sp. TT07R-123 TaxID=2733863 RepID=UPI001B001685|nr:esterase-like activity of phytase family protein [Catellatospora sp. TT07R-123]GHJ48288.1 glycerophosphoryl diester phosphodiesterase [Catellatospora sp. TT07R-123]
MTRLPRLAVTGLAVLTLAVALPASGSAAPADSGRTADFGPATLTGFAKLPAATFVPASDPSGSLLGAAPVNGITPPFADQPVQGFSGIARNRDGSYDVLSDNGYGNIANSADFVLRIHRIIPAFGSHTVDVVGGINLTDPNGLVPWPLTRADRVLTGSDFDVESIVKDADGGYWIGDEFGPYLLHFDRAGRLLAAPIPLEGVHAPESAARDGVTANLPSSKGFEGMAASPDGRYLYPLLEGTVAGDVPGTLRISQFDRAANAYTGRRWAYPLAATGNAIGDFIAVDKQRFLVIERDNAQGDAAAFKKIFLVDLADRDRDGLADKSLVADLLAIADPQHLGGTADVFRFPFQTIEDVLILDNRTLAVLNDNNFPFSSGRTPGQPDDDEFITIRLDRSLHADHRVLD